MYYTEVRDRKKFKSEEESERKTKMQKTMGTDRKCAIFAEQYYRKLHSVVSSRND